jgi:hypothetical protein
MVAVLTPQKSLPLQAAQASGLHARTVAMLEALWVTMPSVVRMKASFRKRVDEGLCRVLGWTYGSAQWRIRLQDACQKDEMGREPRFSPAGMKLVKLVKDRASTALSGFIRRRHENPWDCGVFYGVQPWRRTFSGHGKDLV